MTAASTSDARKRNAAQVDPIEVVQAALVAGFHDEPTPGHSVNPQFGCWQCESGSSIAVAALRAEGLLP